MCFPGAETVMSTAMAMAQAAATAAGPTLQTVGSVLANPAMQAALTAGGTGAQIIGQQQAVNAMDSVAAAESRRQRGFRENQQNITNDIIGGSRRNVREEDILRRERRISRDNDRVRASAPNVRISLPGSAPASRSVESSSARYGAELGGNTDRIANAFARGGAYRGNSGAHMRELSNLFSRLQTEGSLARGSASVLPLELQQAQTQGQGMRTLGDALMATAALSAMSNGFSGLFGGGSTMPSPQLDPRMNAPQTLGGHVVPRGF